MDSQDFISFAYLLSRYIHIVATALLIGGTLFYELIFPVAIDGLRDEQKLWIFARARWAFRWIVWSCTLALLLSGLAGTYRNWYAYNGMEARTVDPYRYYLESPHSNVQLEGTGYWWLGHAACGVLGIAIALALVHGRTPPRYPLVWMRINLVILMVVLFLGSTTHHMRLRLIELHLPENVSAIRD